MERFMIGFVHRSFNFVIYSNISTVFWWYSFSDHRVDLFLFGFVGPISFQLQLEAFQTKWRTFIIQPLPFYSVSFHVNDIPVSCILGRLF